MCKKAHILTCTISCPSSSPQRERYTGKQPSERVSKRKEGHDTKKMGSRPPFNLPAAPHPTSPHKPPSPVRDADAPDGGIPLSFYAEKKQEKVKKNTSPLPTPKPPFPKFPPSVSQSRKTLVREREVPIVTGPDPGSEEDKFRRNVRLSLPSSWPKYPLFLYPCGGGWLAAAPP